MYGPWAFRNGVKGGEIINVYWEEELHRDVDDLRLELGIEAPPDLRSLRRRERRAAKKKKDNGG